MWDHDQGAARQNTDKSNMQRCDDDNHARSARKCRKRIRARTDHNGNHDNQNCYDRTEQSQEERLPPRQLGPEGISCPGAAPVLLPALLVPRGPTSPAGRTSASPRNVASERDTLPAPASHSHSAAHTNQRGAMRPSMWPPAPAASSRPLAPRPNPHNHRATLPSNVARAAGQAVHSRPRRPLPLQLRGSSSVHVPLH